LFLFLGVFNPGLSWQDTTCQLLQVKPLSIKRVDEHPCHCRYQGSDYVCSDCYTEEYTYVIDLNYVRGKVLTHFEKKMGPWHDEYIDGHSSSGGKGGKGKVEATNSYDKYVNLANTTNYIPCSYDKESGEFADVALVRRHALGIVYQTKLCLQIFLIPVAIIAGLGLGYVIHRAIGYGCTKCYQKCEQARLANFHYLVEQQRNDKNGEDGLDLEGMIDMI
jgi:hypothetical protein